MALSSWRKLWVSVPLVLLIMILMRLVWMQLRTYPPEIPTRVSEGFSLLEEKSGGDCVLAGWQPSPGLGGPVRPVLVSPGYVWLGRLACGAGLLETGQVIRLNQWLLAAAVFFMTLTVRFIATSWPLAIGAAAMLLSRGRLLTDIGVISADMVIMTLLCMYLCFLAHYVRTASRFAASGCILAIFLGGLFEPVAAVGALAFPVVLVAGSLLRARLLAPVVGRMRQARQRLALLESRGSRLVYEDSTGVKRVMGTLRWMLGMDADQPVAETATDEASERGSMLQTLRVPFIVWIYQGHRWLGIAVLWCMAGFAALAAGILLIMIFDSSMGTESLQDWWKAWQIASVRVPLDEFRAAWISAQYSRVDLHLLTSLAVVLVSALQSPGAGLPGYFELAWTALLLLVFFLVGALFLDRGDFALVYMAYEQGLQPWAYESRRVMMWLEPIFLTLGLTGLYNLIRVLDSRVAENR